MDKIKHIPIVITEPDDVKNGLVYHDTYSYEDSRSRVLSFNNLLTVVSLLPIVRKMNRVNENTNLITVVQENPNNIDGDKLLICEEVKGVDGTVYWNNCFDCNSKNTPQCTLEAILKYTPNFQLCVENQLGEEVRGVAYRIVRRFKKNTPVYNLLRRFFPVGYVNESYVYLCFDGVVYSSEGGGVRGVIIRVKEGESLYMAIYRFMASEHAETMGITYVERNLVRE